jgi:hypothetical protein
MIRRVIAIFLACLTFAALAHAAEDRDGDWWNHLPELQKATYVVGFFDGQRYALGLFDGATLLAAGPVYDPDNLRVLSKPARIVTEEIKRDFGSVSAGQLVAGLNKIFADYRNTRIAVKDAMIIVVRSMGGMSDDEITKLIEQKRKEAAQ